MTESQTPAKLFGIFLIASFVSYGTGSALVDAATKGPIDHNLFVLGAILMAVVHTALNVGVAAIMYGFLAPLNRFAAMAYLGMALIGTTTLVTAVVFLLILLGLPDVPEADVMTVTMIAKNGGFFGYQLGMAIWGIGGLTMVGLLCNAKMVPQSLLVFGGIGYLIFVTGTVAEIAGYPIGTLLSLPGGMFELSLSLWLIFKGIRPVNQTFS